MTVYVDDMRRRARVGQLDARWSHLMADTRAELDAFADRLGLRRLWIQKAGTCMEHYDVTDSMRARALRLGAVPITYADSGRLAVAKMHGETFTPNRGERTAPPESNERKSE